MLYRIHVDDLFIARHHEEWAALSKHERKNKKICNEEQGLQEEKLEYFRVAVYN